LTLLLSSFEAASVMLSSLVFKREPDEELLVQAGHTLHQNATGILFLTSHRVLWCRSGKILFSLGVAVLKFMLHTGSLVPAIDLTFSKISSTSCIRSGF
jgi:hypothetical protein